MSQTSTRILKAGLSALHYTGAARMLAPAARGLGAVFMLHHVTPEQPAGFAPNRLLQITPEFLETVIGEVGREGFDIVSLDEAHARAAGQTRAHRPFACFTFDDGYRDNRDHAYPILKRHGVPFTVYVASDFADGRGFLWWLVLEQVIACRKFISIGIEGRSAALRCVSDAEKTAAFERIYWWLRKLPEAIARTVVATLAEESGIDHLAPCRDLVMTWDEIRALAGDPLVTIGAHTVGHVALAKLSGDASRHEIASSVRRVETELGRPCRHFCYPYGDAGSAGEREFEITAQLGLATAMTTRKGFVNASHAGRLTALPRVSLNGEYQRMRYLKALLSGVPFALWQALERPAAPAQTRVPGYVPA